MTEDHFMSEAVSMVTYADGTCVVFPREPNATDPHRYDWAPEEDGLVTAFNVWTSRPIMWVPEDGGGLYGLVRSAWWDPDCYLCQRAMCMVRVFVWMNGSTMVIHGTHEV